jgi:Fur family ferric uptake transcriptional regulator/Fur family peroxide stress response transcriptional regulator
LEKLQASGIRPSLQRMAVMDFLTKNFTHPTIDAIYCELQQTIPTLSKTTVYNTVKTLSDSGAIQTIFIDEKNLRYDANTTLHAHFKCNRCGSITDLPIKNWQVEMENDKELSITESHLYYKGLCVKCKTEIN